MTGNSFPIKAAFTGQSWQELRHLNQDSTVSINPLFISDYCTNHFVFFFCFFPDGLWQMKDNYEMIIQQQRKTGMNVLIWTQFKRSLCCQVWEEGFISGPL